jgi:hypothetical protein
MSKKQIQKKKVTVKVMPGEAIFVADMEVLKSIMDVYSNMAKESKDEKDIKYYSSIVSQILDWTTKTFYSGQADDEEEW